MSVQHCPPYVGPITEQEIQQAEASLQNAMLRSDVEALNALLSDSLVFTNHLGHVLNKQDDLDAHRSRLLKVHDLAASEMRIQINGAFAVVTVRVQLSGEYGGQPASGDFRFTRVWARPSTDVNCQVVAAHSVLAA